MARRSPLHLLLVLVLVALLLPLISSPALQAEQADTAVQADTPIPSGIDSTSVLKQDTSIRINEVMPKPDEGDSEWVELYRPSIYLVYLPLILRNASSSVADTHGFAYLPSESVLSMGQFDISGWQITDEDGNNYEIPDELPEVPRDAYVLVLFDGSGSGADDYDFGDGLAVLHTSNGLVNIFEDEADQVALYSGSAHSPETIVDFVAWGEPPGDDANNPASGGIWQEDWYVNTHIGFGLEIEDEEGMLGESLGVLPNCRNDDPGDWAVYLGDDLSPGTTNPLPRAYASTVADGEVLTSDGFAWGWSWIPGATYQLQIDDGLAFESPLIDLMLEMPWYAPEQALEPGQYWWRVRAIDPQWGSSQWSAPAEIGVLGVTSESSPLDRSVSVLEESFLPITWLRQRKDTSLLCLDGCNEGDPAAPSPKETWDSPHPDGIFEHGSTNCARASIAMIATNYGGNLSQDRIAYEERKDLGGGGPVLDLGHGRGTPPSEVQRLLAWALGVAEADILHAEAKPSFEAIRGWIDNGRPIFRGHKSLMTKGHATVIGGYRILALGAIREILIFDPWVRCNTHPSGGCWRLYDEVPIDVYFVSPESAPDVRSDEPDIRSDFDHDGIMDWDEITRWTLYTDLDPTKSDTDADGVPDKADMREYLFDASGIYAFGWADWDGDGLNKEIDADNDDGGSLDGCEDTNYNGRYESWRGETSNFDRDQEKECPPVSFRDDFSGDALDLDLWQAYENGGTIQVQDGSVTLARGYGTMFPYVHSRFNPLPETGNFSVRVGIQYLSVTNAGTGFDADNELEPNGTPQGSHTPFVYAVWQGLSPGLRIWSWGWVSHYYSPPPDVTFHDIELRWLGDTDEYYVDGVLVDSGVRDPDTPRPTVLWFGNPYRQSIFVSWPSFRIDYIEVNLIE